MIVNPLLPSSMKSWASYDGCPGSTQTWESKTWPRGEHRCSRCLMNEYLKVQLTRGGSLQLINWLLHTWGNPETTHPLPQEAPEIQFYVETVNKSALSKNPRQNQGSQAVRYSLFPPCGEVAALHVGHWGLACAWRCLVWIWGTLGLATLNRISQRLN